MSTIKESLLLPIWTEVGRHAHLHDSLPVIGIYLVGGGGMLRGLDERLAVETEIPVHLVDAPLECVVLGAGRCIEAYEDLKVMFMDART